MKKTAVIPSVARNLLLVVAVLLVIAVPFTAWAARRDSHRDAAVARPIVPDDTASLLRVLHVVRGVDPLLCEVVVRNVDMHGWWSHWGPISNDPLDADSSAAAIIRWIQDDHNDPRLVPALVAAIRDPDNCTRRVAGSFLGRIDHPSARSALLSALDDASAGTRSVAALGLGLAEYQGAVRPLIGKLRDESADVRRASAWALGSIEDTAATASLVAVLARDPDARVRQAAAWAIGNSAK